MTQPDPSAQSGAMDPGAQSGAGGAGDSGTTTQTASGAQSGTGTATTTVTDTGRSETETELEKQRARALAADQRAAKAEADLKQLRDKDLPEMDKLRRDLADAAKRAEDAETALRKARIENAFLVDNEFDWHNPERVLALLDLGGVEIDKDGKVGGLKAAIQKLAKEEPYLVKPKSTDDGKDKDQQGGDGQTPPVATPPFNTGAPGTDKAKADAAMARRFPALRTRPGGGS